MDIGLAPLFVSPFNNARSYTKFLDIARQGAVGLYSQYYPCVDDIENSGAGFICNDDIDDWLFKFDLAIRSNREDMLKSSLDLIDLMDSKCALNRLD